METRNPIHPEHGKALTTEQLRKEFCTVISIE
jgi:5-keto 4-deoxyuronate isomerase